MECNNRARRRLYHLARHVGQNQEDNEWRTWRHAHGALRSVSAQACSAGGGDGFQRRDNRTLFARQSSDTHGQFMRPAPLNQDIRGGEAQVDAGLDSASRRGPDGMCKCGSSSAGKNARREVSDYAPGPSFAAVEPLFARPALQTDTIEKLVTEVHAHNPEPEMPAPYQETESNSARGRTNIEGTGSDQPPATGVETQKEEISLTAKDQTHGDSFDTEVVVFQTCPYNVCLWSADMETGVVGFEWFPRMDVVESGTAYVITVELPGVSADGIHVEVARGSLIVTGSRATDWWKANNNGNGTVYHRRELAQGPYRAVWRLPKKGDINGITAEFIDGFLRVLIPKIKVMTYL